RPLNLTRPRLHSQQAHLPGRDIRSIHEQPVSNGNQITRPGQVQRPVRQGPQSHKHNTNLSCEAAVWQTSKNRRRVWWTGGSPASARSSLPQSRPEAAEFAPAVTRVGIVAPHPAQERIATDPQRSAIENGAVNGFLELASRPIHGLSRIGIQYVNVERHE